MSELRLDTLRMPAADVGPENPLASLAFNADVYAGANIAGVDEDMSANIEYGRLNSVLPHLLQDGYSRNRSDTDFATAVLENDVLRATFLLDYGGRLWSLVHKPTGRELLHRNPIFQPANLALRNAWFAGGVEWNIGVSAHTPLTCSPLHAARVTGTDGTPVLRLYEYDRIREVVYALDFWLPEHSPVLLVHVTITNPHDHPVPMYWWSNVAVPETDGLRILAPSDSAYQWAYADRVQTIPIPIHGGEDVTYPAHAQHATEFFFDVRAAARPWIAALDQSGSGLAQVSTARLIGRKLWVWGHGPGGRRWQEFLSGPGSGYCEIQSGLARTQLERLPMPALVRWSWTEAYGLLQADADTVHGTDWTEACAAAEQGLDRLIPAQTLNAASADACSWADQPPETLLHNGSGWGALEQRRRAAANEPLLSARGTPFAARTLGPQQQPWIDLLETGTLPHEPPRSYVTGSAWRALLDAAADTPEVWLHRGIAAWHAGERDIARAAWEEAGDSPWALRNLALADPPRAADLLLAAHVRCPSLLPLTLETIRALLAADRPQDALQIIETQSRDARDGRITVLEIEASLAVGAPDRAGRIFDAGFVVADLREGERSLSELWFTYQEARAVQETGRLLDDNLRAEVRTQYPVPARYDFRMH